jgi:hypothetical protein
MVLRMRKIAGFRVRILEHWRKGAGVVLLESRQNLPMFLKNENYFFVTSEKSFSKGTMNLTFLRKIKTQTL